MLPRQMSRAAIAAAVVLSVSVANAQFYGAGYGPVTAPVAACTPIQPVQTTCYQTVPVTTFRREKQTVRVPYYKTSHEERDVTVMRPVTTRREVEVPTVSYRNVTEHRTVQRDMGRWLTRYQPVQKYSACQVDSRPGLIGWLSRSGHSFRTAFMPNYTTSRQYVPNMMACTVPVTRLVQVRGTRRVTVNETRMVAERKTERIPVQRLAWREETRTVMRPETAYRTVPIGTQLAYGYGGYGLGAATAFAPIIQDSRTALGPTPDPISDNSRTADGRKRFSEGESEGYNRRRSAIEDDPQFHRSKFSRPLDPATDRRTFQDGSRAVDPIDELPNFGASQERSGSVVIPAAYRQVESSESSGWKRTSRKTARRSSQTASGRSRISLTLRSEN